MPKNFVLFCKTMLSLLFCLVVTGCNLPSEKDIELKTSEAVLTIDNSNRIIIRTIDNDSVSLYSEPDSIFRIILINKRNNSESILIPQNGRISEITGNGLKVSTETPLSDVTGEFLKTELIISVKDDAFCFSGSVISMAEEWIIKEITCPLINEIRYKGTKTNIYWPNSLGERFPDPVKFGKRSFDYPSTNGSMAWFTLNSDHQGIYFGCHDKDRGSKTFRLEYFKEREIFRSSVTFPVYSNDFKMPPVVIRLYNGSWHVAAKYYRSWFDKNFEMPHIPDWMRENAGLMLTILKQQNGSIMWNYNDIDKLCDIAGSLNIKLIGLWGWAVGGHDRLYPDYTPDELLGGEITLKKAISAAQKRGFRIIVYSNGTIMDSSTDYYRKNGIAAMQMNEKGQPNIEFYLKHSNTTPVILARACPGSALWRNTILGLAQKAESLGTDAFYIDQVGVRGPFLCFSSRHDHLLPQEAYTTYRFKMMHDIRAEMLKIHPDFSIMTEGTVDALLPEVDVFHGLGPGSMITANSYPELFRYTFPESIIIQLNPSPALTRYDANFAAVYGLRHEIMSRYEPDAEYLKSGRIPSAKDYSGLFINDPPSVNKITEAPAEVVTDYIHKLIGFENRYNMFFRSGKFVDQEGIEYSGEDIVAKGFQSGNRLGVVVWNSNRNEERSYSVQAAGYKLVETAEPVMDDHPLTNNLKPNTLRLLIFEKD